MGRDYSSFITDEAEPPTVPMSTTCRKGGHMVKSYELKPLKPHLTLSKVLDSLRASTNPLIPTGEATISIVREQEYSLIFKELNPEDS